MANKQTNKHKHALNYGISFAAAWQNIQDYICHKSDRVSDNFESQK